MKRPISFKSNFILKCRFLTVVNHNSNNRNDNNIFLIHKIHIANV